MACFALQNKTHFPFIASVFPREERKPRDSFLIPDDFLVLTGEIWHR